ncbi:glutamate-cysteine ligase [Tieghemostelium lacteum]|uniref:Glutamate--cysteine ligase n=1 Tax=Tieghemostelium lacteum TaxID=361077 RepID=A0A151ZIY3_TIELA|nr:glutamate-cysteine ligase [Tieghemostelium lacteum]|eukprot:KYQ93916.1 glutamate-cysteine ligase [Tieghemostelium lacteum]
MGFIAEGNTLNWEDAKKFANYIREHGIIQFLNIYNANKDRSGDQFKWGDEVEYILIEKDQQTYKLKLRANEILDKLIAEEKANPDGVEYLWRPEYGRFMIEGTPGKPYIGLGKQLLTIEESLISRRKNVNRFLKDSEYIMTLVNYPRLGCKDETIPSAQSKGVVAESQFLSDLIINPHFRFSTLTANIRQRRGKNVSINIPMFRDVNTPAYLDQTSYISPSSSREDPTNQPYNIYMDAMGFGMGCCCLQTTFQLSNIEEARTIYDHMAVFAPIMLSLTAASSVFKGYLSDIDARWTVIAQSVDDRTSQELGTQPLSTNKHLINKSRYDSIDYFISRSSSYRSEYNDLDLVYDHEIYQQLIQGGIDTQLAKHFSHLFIRDPLVIYSDKITIDDQLHSDHFENIQSTNWQTVRFKPPTPNSNIGWRVEFRPMEVQLTDFENAAFIVFISLLVKAISELKLNFYIPISKVDQNMKTAHFRDSCRKSKFYFRKNINDNSTNDKIEDEYELMTINEIFNGQEGSDFVGLISMVRKFISTQNFDQDTLNLTNNYLEFISKRASGELLTMSSWTRDFITSHPAYKHDSCVTEEIQTDYMNRCFDIYSKKVKEPKLLGSYYN